MVKRTRLQIRTTEKILHRVAGSALCDGMRRSAIPGSLGIELFLPSPVQEEPAVAICVFRRITLELFWVRPTGQRPQGRPRTSWRDYSSQLVCWLLGFPSGGATFCYGVKGGLGSTDGLDLSHDRDFSPGTYKSVLLKGSLLLKHHYYLLHLGLCCMFKVNETSPFVWSESLSEREQRFLILGELQRYSAVRAGSQRCPK